MRCAGCHAGRDDEELGQAVFPVQQRDEDGSATRRRTLELSVSGECRGTVSFDLRVKVKRRRRAMPMPSAREEE